MRRNKLIVLLFAGVISLASLSISFSLAWYAAGALLRVDSIDVSIRSERNLEVSLDEKEGFKSALLPSELKKTSLLSPVSTMFEEYWRNSENPTPKFYTYDNSIFIPSDGVPFKPSEMTYGFFQQEIYIRCDTNAYVGIDTVNTYATSNRHYKADTSEEIEDLNPIDRIVRISIYDTLTKDYYIIDPHKDGDTYYGGPLDVDKNKYFDTYTDTNGVTKEAIYGELENREKAVYQEVGDNDIQIAEGTDYSAANARHKAHTEMLMLDESINNGLVIKKEPSLTFEDLVGYYYEEGNKLVLTLDRNVPRKLVLSIYLEGWDKECTNKTMGKDFLANIQFKIIRER